MSRLKLRRSLTLNAASLMVATLATNMLGLVFWAEAAHLEPPWVVGRAAAGVAALTLLAGIAQLNLTNVLIRLLPVAGRLGIGLIRRGYLAVIALSVAIASLYVSTPLSDHVITGGWLPRGLFALAVPVLAIFALQDSVLTALRLTPWVPVENVSFSISKLALLPLFVLLPPGGIIASWVLPAAVAVIVVSVVLFRRVLPRLARLDGTLPDRRRLLSFVAGEYVSNICAIATIQLMPLLVVWRLGATEAAFFSIPWLALMALTFLLYNVSSSFTVEMLGEHGRADRLIRRSLLLWAAIALTSLAACVLLADPLLSLVGSRYAVHGASLLRLIGASMPFSAIVALYSTFVWLDQRVWLLAAIQAGSGIALLTLTLILLPAAGLTAPGWANLAVQGIEAAIMAPLAMRWIRRHAVLVEAR
ncbi:MAG: polysaccharide biosynthesis protein [Solirubrobacteraceae bacterium]